MLRHMRHNNDVIIDVKTFWRHFCSFHSHWWAHVKVWYSGAFRAWIHLIDARTVGLQAIATPIDSQRVCAPQCDVHSVDL